MMKRFEPLRWLPWIAVLAIVTGVGAQEPPAAITEGQTAIDFDLATFGDETVSLSQFQGEDGKFVVVTFVRAFW
ncbi:MAG: hypothetical protein AAGF97_01665 [Planctomycetota bacterium]